MLSNVDGRSVTWQIASCSTSADSRLRRTRTVAQSLLVSRSNWAKLLIEAIEAGRIEAKSIHESSVRRLMLSDSAAIREASATFAKQTAFTLGLPNGSQGGITFEETDRLSDELAVYLREVAGFKAGDRVAIQMPNCLPYPIAVFGVLKAGLVMVNTNPLYTTAEIVHQFTDSGAVGLIVIDLFAPKVAEVLPKTSITTVVVVSISDLLPTMKRL